MMIEDTDNTNNQQLLYDLAQELSSLIIREHQILRDELNQVGALVEDASQTLGDNFRALKECVAEKNSASEHMGLTETSDDMADGGSEVLELTRQVDSYATEMMRALQFDDIVQQLAGHADERIRQMQELFRVMDEKLSELKTNQPEDLKETQLHLRVMLANVKKYRELLEKGNPVRQESMSAGSIELF